MKKEVKIFFEDLLKKTHINGLAMVAVNTTSNSHEIFVDIDYPMPDLDEDRENRRSAYLKFKFSPSYFTNLSIEDIPEDKILERIQKFDFERPALNKFGAQRPHEIWVIDESNELSREEIFPNEK